MTDTVMTVLITCKAETTSCDRHDLVSKLGLMLMSAIPALMKLRQENHAFEASLSPVGSLQPV